MTVSATVVLMLVFFMTADAGVFIVVAHWALVHIQIEFLLYWFVAGRCEDLQNDGNVILRWQSGIGDQPVAAALEGELSWIRAIAAD